jgi:hypothetical protein
MMKFKNLRAEFKVFLINKGLYIEKTANNRIYWNGYHGNGHGTQSSFK